jgi:hypothetical protein
LKEMEACPSYRRAVAIPKEPNNTSWQQLKPKLEKEAAELRLGRATPETRLGTASASASGTSTPNSMQPYHHPLPVQTFVALPPPHPFHPQYQPQAHPLPHLQPHPHSHHHPPQH